MPSSKTLAALANLDPSAPVPAAALAPHDGPAEALRLARRLEDEGLVEIVRQRPKLLGLAARPFPRALHGMLRTRPHLGPLLQGSALRVVAVLAARGEEGGAPTIADIARRSGLSERTVHSVLQRLKRRSLLTQVGHGHRLAPNAPELARLGLLYRDHVLEEKLRRYPDVFPVAVRGTRMIVEAERAVTGLAPTASYRFQTEGADVLAPRFQYALTFADEGTGLEDALSDMMALAPPPRTARAVEAFLRSRSDG